LSSVSTAIKNKHFPWLLSADTVEKLDNLVRVLIREDASLGDFLYLPMNIDKYGLNG